MFIRVCWLLRSLQDVLASHNQITELSHLATQLPALEVLDLTNNEITHWDQMVRCKEE